MLREVRSLTMWNILNRKKEKKKELKRKVVGDLTSAGDAVTEYHIQQQKLSKVKVFNNVIYL